MYNLVHGSSHSSYHIQDWGGGSRDDLKFQTEPYLFVITTHRHVLWPLRPISITPEPGLSA